MCDKFKGFGDLGSEFDDVPVAAGIPDSMESASGNKSIQNKGEFKEKCPKCAGTGRYHRVTEHGLGCLKCKGTGFLWFKTSTADRAEKRKKSASKAVIKGEQNVGAFEILNPEIAAWWNGSNGDFEFARSLKEWVRKNGDLTSGQLGAAKRCIAKLAEMAVARQEREQHAVDGGKLDVSAITKSFGHAKSCGIKRPKMRLLFGDDGMVISEAASHSVNACSLYVKAKDGLYLGKITKGLFFRSRDVDGAMETNIRESLSNPSASAVAYGRRTGECSCCGRELTNAESIERGIGPICADNFGF